MFVTNWISPTKIQKISEITNFFRHYFLSRTEVLYGTFYLFKNDKVKYLYTQKSLLQMPKPQRQQAVRKELASSLHL